MSDSQPEFAAVIKERDELRAEVERLSQEKTELSDAVISLNAEMRTYSHTRLGTLMAEVENLAKIANRTTTKGGDDDE